MLLDPVLMKTALAKAAHHQVLLEALQRRIPVALLVFHHLLVRLSRLVGLILSFVGPDEVVVLSEHHRVAALFGGNLALVDHLLLPLALVVFFCHLLHVSEFLAVYLGFVQFKRTCRQKAVLVVLASGSVVERVLLNHVVVVGLQRRLSRFPLLRRVSLVGTEEHLEFVAVHGLGLAHDLHLHLVQRVIWLLIVLLEDSVSLLLVVLEDVFESLCLHCLGKFFAQGGKTV